MRRVGRSAGVIALGALLVAGLCLWWWAGHQGVAESPGGGGSAVARAGPGAPASVDGTLDARARAKAPGVSTAMPPTAATGGPTSGTLRVRVRWATSLTPVSRTVIQVLHGQPVPVHRLETDDDGRAVWEGAPVGRLTLFVAIGAWFEVGVSAEGAAEEDLLVVEGIRVVGTVRDEKGSPVAGAAIWLGQSGFSNQGTDVGESGRDGTYSILTAEMSACVGARGRGRGPSLRRFASGARGETVSLDLLLPGAGGSLRVRVVDGDGSSVSGATVLVGTAEVVSRQLEDGELANFPTAFFGTTGATGEAVFEGLPKGEQPVRVRADGHAMHLGSTTIDPERPTVLDVRLAPSALVVGTARDANGAPLSDVRVSRFLGSDTSIPFSFDVGAMTDVQGNYSLDGLTLGEVGLQARRSYEPILRTSVVLAAGRTIRWDPVFPRSARISGRLVDTGGVARVGWRIRAGSGSWLEGGVRSNAETRTDADGRFALGGLLDLPHRLEAWPPSGAGVPAGSWADVRPGDGERRLEVPEDSAMARLVGRLRDVRGRVPDGATLQVARQPGGERHYVALDAATGAFRVGPIGAGRYRLRVDVQGLPSFDGGDVRLGAGEERDLGTLSLPATGELHVHIDLPEERGLGSTVAVLVQGDRVVQQFEPHPSGHCEPQRVYVGEYRLELRGDAVGDAVPCVVRADEVVQVKIVGSPAIGIVFAIRVPVDAPTPARLHVEVVGADGQVEAKQDQDVPAIGDRPRDAEVERRTGLRPLAWCSFSVRPGQWTLRATTDTGLSATIPVYALAMHSNDSDIEVVLRR